MLRRGEEVEGRVRASVLLFPRRIYLGLKSYIGRIMPIPMYTYLRFLMIGLSIIFLNISCVKDQQSSTDYSGVLHINGNSYTVDKGYLQSYGPTMYPDNYGNTMELYLFTSGVDVNLDEYGNPDFEGDGYLLYFLLYSESELKLTDGDYSFERLGKKAFTFEELIAEPLGSEKEGAEAISCQEGKLAVSSISGIQQLCGTFDGQAINGAAEASFSFVFNGHLIHLD